MPKSLKSPSDHVAAIAEARRKTQDARFKPLPAGVERVADVIAASCAEVARAFEAEGFRWAKSSLSFSRKVDAFTHTVSFQPDSSNLSGRHVAVAVHARVRSAALKEWRLENGVTSSDNVWTTQLGYLSPAHEYYKWQLVDPVDRKQQVESIITKIKQLALPAFAVCASQQALSDHLLDRREMTWTPNWAAEIALWVGNREAAEALCLSYLDAHASDAPAFWAEVERLRSAPSFSGVYRPCEQLAALVVRHDLQVPRKG